MIDFNNFAGFLKVVGFKCENDLSKARFLSTLLLPRLPETKMTEVQSFRYTSWETSAFLTYVNMAYGKVFHENYTTKAKKLVKCYLSEYNQTIF